MLSHLTLMIRTSAVFPIVNDGSAPMMPVDAHDVAAAVVGALGNPASSGKIYEVVGPDRLTLRGVVERVAEANGLPVKIWSTPVALMRLPVRIMEAVMRQPLSTRAQLAMLSEGLPGDPEPARRELGVTPSPFTADRLRPIVLQVRRGFPFDLRLFSAPRPKRETPAVAAWSLFAFAAALLTFALRGMSDSWTGMLLAMGAVLPISLFLKSVRHRFAPSFFRAGTGLAAGALLYGMTVGMAALLGRVWPAWEGHVRALYAWRGDHGAPFLMTTLVVIVAGEEVLWRGVVTRWMMERLGRAGGDIRGRGALCGRPYRLAQSCPSWSGLSLRSFLGLALRRNG